MPIGRSLGVRARDPAYHELRSLTSKGGSMAVLYVYESPNAPIDMYDRVRAEIDAEGTPDGAICHVACKRDGGGLYVIEVWENEQAHDAFSDALQDRIRKIGGPPRPEPLKKLPVYNMVIAEETAGTY
jgi:hypothetical protein